MEEINNYIETIDEIEKYIDWAVGNAESPLKIQIVDKMGYAQKKVQELSSKLVLSVATMQHFNYIDTTKFNHYYIITYAISHIGLHNKCSQRDKTK